VQQCPSAHPRLRVAQPRTHGPNHKRARVPHPRRVTACRLRRLRARTQPKNQASRSATQLSLRRHAPSQCCSHPPADQAQTDLGLRRATTFGTRPRPQALGRAPPAPSPTKSLARSTLNPPTRPICDITRDLVRADTAPFTPRDQRRLPPSTKPRNPTIAHLPSAYDDTPTRRLGNPPTSAGNNPRHDGAITPPHPDWTGLLSERGARGPNPRPQPPRGNGAERRRSAARVAEHHSYAHAPSKTAETVTRN